MENVGWNDPLLITDVSCQHERSSYSQDPTTTTSSNPPEMVDQDLILTSYANDDVLWHDGDFGDPLKNDFIDGRTMLGFSLTSPDLVVCTGSPDIPAVCFEESPKFLKKKHASIEVSLENGITGPEMEEDSFETPIASNSHSSWHVEAKEDMYPADSFELLPPRSQVIETEQSKAEELEELKKAVMELKRDNEVKDRQCKEALKSLHDLHNELMHKSMHVGSLAFAIEGQVKEKSKWFSSLRDMKRNVKILKLEQIKLSEEALLYNKKCLADINDIGLIIQAKLNHKLQLHESLKLKFMKADKERKEHYNKILELKGNIRVFCRCRPLNTEEIASGASTSIEFEASNDGELTVKSNGIPKKLFKFDRVFGPEANQGDVFEDTAPFASSVLDGYNVCIFAYGQTGTGKTFTMVGTDEARGVNFRTLEQLFHIINERKEQFQYEITVSVLEVYNEQIRDLLASETKRLEIRQVGDGIHNVPGLVEAPVNNINEVWEVLETGNNARAVGSTNANEQSSRSHCIHCVMVKGENLLNGECTRSKLWLVDLAGSERIAKTEVQGERLKETQNINRSLSALGDVISSLATKSPHIPFRNSKLTHLLQDSLGGDSKTLMFVQISPNENDLSETICSLNFASRVKGVELGPAKKQLDSTELFKFKHMAEKTKLDIKTKDIQIKRLEDTIHGLDVKVKEKDFKNKSLQDKVKELESQLLIERRLARQHVDSKLAEQQQQEETNFSFSRPPLVARRLGDYRFLNETKLNQLLPLTRSKNENDEDVMEKENTTEQQLQVPKNSGRASLCPIIQRIPMTTAGLVPRRSSAFPLPSARFPPPMLAPLPSIKSDESEENNEAGFPEFGQWDTSPKKEGGGGKKLIGTCLLRRSIKRNNMQLRSPMLVHQQMRRGGGINVGMEKVRVSIGVRGRMTQRVLLNNARRATRDIQPKQNHKDKERGWNI